MANDYQYTPTNLNVGKARITVWASLIGITILLIWASFAKIDQVTRATARVIASARTQEIQASCKLGIKNGCLDCEGSAFKSRDF